MNFAFLDFATCSSLTLKFKKFLITSDKNEEEEDLRLVNSVTRLGDFLHFGQLFKAYGNNYFAQIAHSCRQFL